MKEQTFVPCCTPITQDNYNKMLPFMESTGIEIYESYDSTYPNDKVEENQHISEVNKHLYLFFYEKNWYTEYSSANKIQATIEEVKKYFGKEDLTLESIQVDCRELSKEQIESMCYVYESNGFEIDDMFDSVKKDSYILSYNQVQARFKQFGFYNNNDFSFITYDKFMELFGSEENNVIDKPTQGVKETAGKCNFELDFNFIEEMAMRIQNETKYEPYNWKLPLNTDELSNALLRHAIEVKKGNFDDNGELGHLMAIANNAMFLYYQLKNNK